MENVLKLIRMSDVQPEEVHWLWYPYIPFGKLTIIQGDSGEGKTTFVLAVISAMTKGDALPERDAAEPVNVIYQTAEDGLADTIRPRLDALGADCSRVLVIDESKKELSLNDERIKQAIEETGAKLIVLDPLQAYLGADVDMTSAKQGMDTVIKQTQWQISQLTETTRQELSEAVSTAKLWMVRIALLTIAASALSMILFTLVVR